MKENHLPVLEHTIQKTNIWLKKPEEEHHLGTRHHAYSALRPVLRLARSPDTGTGGAFCGAAADPHAWDLFRGLAHLTAKPAATRHLDEFLARVSANLPPQFPRDALGGTKAVFDLLWKELDAGETAKVIASLPAALRALWPEAARE